MRRNFTVQIPVREDRASLYLHAGALADVAIAGGPQHLGACIGLALQLPHGRLLRSRAMKRKRLLPMAAAAGGATSR